MPVQAFIRDQQWLLPPSLSDLIPRTMRSGSSPNSSMP